MTRSFHGQSQILKTLRSHANDQQRDGDVARTTRQAHRSTMFTQAPPQNLRWPVSKVPEFNFQRAGVRSKVLGSEVISV